MKKGLGFVFILVALSVEAYQVGGVSRPNFTSSTGQKEEAAVPAQTPVQTRSFTSYGSRPGNGWRQGVKTETVQTQTATSAAQKNKDPKIQDPVAEPGTAEAEAKPVSQPKVTSKKEEKGAVSASNAAKPAGQPASKDESASSAQGAEAMQQLQNLQGMMGALGAMTGGQTGSETGSAASPAGIPDVSALMKAAQGGSKK